MSHPPVPLQLALAVGATLLIATLDYARTVRVFLAL